MSIYQSKIRQTIQRDVYHKPSFMVSLFGKDYFGMIKEKKIGPFTLKRYQVLGVELPDNPSEIRQVIKTIKSEFGSSWKNIFFQFGITTYFKTFAIVDGSRALFDSIRDMRTKIRDDMQHKYGLLHSFRENLPEAEIVYDLRKTDQELLHEMNKSSAHRVRRGIKNNISVRELGSSEYDVFWNKWQKTADKKGFHTISKSQYLHLVSYLIEHNEGAVLVSEDQGEILAGSIMFFDHKNVVCLYGFSDRKFATVGGQQYLKFKTFQWARDRGFLTCDIMGGAPTGFPDHELASVSAFKESMGGTKSECVGNFDIVLNPWLYKLFKKHFSLSHRKLKYLPFLGIFTGQALKRDKNDVKSLLLGFYTGLKKFRRLVLKKG